MCIAKDLLIFIALVPLFQVLHNANSYQEAHQAKANIDSLFETLSSKLLTLKMRLNQTKQKITKTTQELATVKRLQNLLEELNKHGSCEHEYMLLDYSYKQAITIEALSKIPAHYTITIKVDHKTLVDKKQAEKNGQDLRVFYLPSKGSLPVEIDRFVSNLYTKTTTVQFQIQKPIPTGTVDRNSYALMFGGKFGGNPKSDLRKVFAFYDDFGNSRLLGWKTLWGEWISRKGMLFGKTGQKSSNVGKRRGVGLYLMKGERWGNIEVDLDVMVVGGNLKVNPGVYLRVENPTYGNITAWHFTYETGTKKCAMVPYKKGKGSPSYPPYQCRLTVNFMKNKWLHLKYRLQGNLIEQWVNGSLIQRDNVDSQWMIRRGSIGLGCGNSNMWGGECRINYDNVKVQLLIDTEPEVSLGRICNVARSGKKTIRPIQGRKGFKIGTKVRPALSCELIYRSNRATNNTLPKNGVYWIKTSDEGKLVKTFCDMNMGGWTLVGKISGKAGNIYNSWLVRNVNVDSLSFPKLPTLNGKYGCLDARRLAVKHSTHIMFSSGENAFGVGAKWVRWQLPSGRDYSTWWDHAVGYKKVKSASTSPVTVTAWNGRNQTCYQNKYGIMPLQQHGGSYPYASHNKQGNTATRDNCMAVGVLLGRSSANGWSQNANGYDSPQSDSDWPNSSYNHQKPYLLVWLK